MAISAAALALPAGAAHWPTDPETPLLVGQAEGSFSPRLSAVSADDGAVWLAWQDRFCAGFSGGFVRLQRVSAQGDLLSPAGLEASPDETCGFVIPPTLVSVGDDAVVGRGLSGLDAEPLQRFTPLGQTRWPGGYTTETVHALAGAVELVGGDALILSTAWDMIRAERISASGEPVWDKPLEFASDNGPNFRVFAALAHPGGGAIVLWDSPAFAYTRMIRAQRITPDGRAAWGTSVRLVQSPPDVTSSRHSDPAAAPDGRGGALLVFTQGFETGLTPAPLLMQRINQDGSARFPLSGVRVSLGAQRQFDPIVLAEPISGDVLVVWRDGQFENQSLRAQRMTIEGDRLWGENGIEIAPIEQDRSFDAAFDSGRLAVAIAEPNGASLHLVSPDGSRYSDRSAVIEGALTESIRVVAALDGFVVTAQRESGLMSDDVIAQRCNRGGRLGPPGCSAADLAEPTGTLDFSDVVAFLQGFAAGTTAGDLQVPFGVFDFSDVIAFLAAFAAGCP